MGGGITNHHLIAYSLSNISAKTLPKLVNVRWSYSVLHQCRFFETQCTNCLTKHQSTPSTVRRSTPVVGEFERIAAAACDSPRICLVWHIFVAGSCTWQAWKHLTYHWYCYCHSSNLNAMPFLLGLSNLGAENLCGMNIFIFWPMWSHYWPTRRNHRWCVSDSLFVSFPIQLFCLFIDLRYHCQELCPMILRECHLMLRFGLWYDALAQLRHHHFSVSFSPITNVIWLGPMPSMLLLDVFCHYNWSIILIFAVLKLCPSTWSYTWL